MENNQLSDIALIRRAANGDQAAFEEIVKMYCLRTYRLAYQIIGSSEDARDIVQEAFDYGDPAIGFRLKWGRCGYPPI